MKWLQLGIFIFLLTSRFFAFEINIEDKSQNEIEIEITFQPNDLNPLSFKTNGISFSRIPLTNEALLFEEAGLPEIPKIHRWLIINSNANYQIKTNPGRHTLHKDVILYPRQGDHLETDIPRFNMNKLAYMRNFWFGSSQATLGAPAKLGALTVLPISFSPVSYNPRRKELKVYESIKVHLTNLNPNSHNSSITISQFTAEQARELTLNGKEYLSTRTRIQASKKLCLVYSPTLKPIAEELAGIHQFEGNETNLVELPVGTSADNLKKLLLSKYQTQNIDAVLFLGDEKMIPLGTSGGSTGDFSYGLLSGNDQISDISVGRVPAKNEVQGRSMLHKIKTHLALKAKGVINKKVMLIAHKQDYPGKYTKNLESIRAASNPRELEYTTQYGGEKAQNTTVIVEAQKGYAILNYRGHGSTSSWSSWGRDGASFSTNHVKALPDNENGLSFIFNVACSNGAVQSSGVALVEQQLFPSTNEETLQGAIGTFGATAPSMTETNHRFNRNLFEFLQVAQDLSIGNIYTLANNKLTKDNGGSATSNTKMYVLYSDPLLAPLFE